jgi:uncharacterized protein
VRFEDQSNDMVEDRRGQGGGGFGGGGFSGGGGRGGGLRLGLVGTIIVIVLSLVFKRNFFSLLGGQGAGGQAGGSQQVGPVGGQRAAGSEQRAADEEPLRRVAVGSFQSAQNAFKQRVEGYRPATLVLFWDSTRSGCGSAGAEMGPFYCPADEKVYIDLGFFRELGTQLGAPGDFAQAYVIAHEMGHHLQTVLSAEARAKATRNYGKNELSVRMELQADCYAGVWGKVAQDKRMTEAGDIEEALRAAAAIGDDRLRKMAGKAVRPESFTHGSSEQRVRWLKRGLTTGEIKACDTFAGAI